MAQEYLDALCEIYALAIKYGEDSLGAKPEILAELVERRQRLLIKSQSIHEKYLSLGLEDLELSLTEKALWQECLQRVKDFKPRFMEQEARMGRSGSSQLRVQKKEMVQNSTHLRAARAYNGSPLHSRWH
jgi:hypothetical protein